MNKINSDYWNARAKRIEELKSKVLEANKTFYSQFTPEELEIVVKVHNYIIERANSQGYRHVVKEGLHPYLAKKNLAKQLTDFQAGVDNLRVGL